MSKILGLCLILVSLSVHANLDNFKKNFQLVRNDQGKLVGVRDNTLSSNFNVKNYVRFIKERLLQEQAMMASKSFSYDNAVLELLGEDDANKQDRWARRRNRDARHNRNVVDSLRALESIDFNAIFNDKGFNEVLAKFEGKLKDVFFYIDPLLVAKPDNETFFYKRNVTKQAVTWALNFARKKLSTVPLLNTASYVITEIEKMITTRRMYHQNMLLHYLELATPEELGMTKMEADTVFSSVYESRIPWFAFWESKNASRTWMKYGANKFYASFRMATNKFRSVRSIYDSYSQRYNYAFQEVVYKGERVIINLVDNNNMIDGKPAIAYSYDNPKKVKRLRTVLTLAQLGVSFVSLPAFIKDITTQYVKSYYENQQITEGALLAHFEFSGDVEMQNELKSQYLNAFDF
jgi:hypothetical protein